MTTYCKKGSANLCIMLSIFLSKIFEGGNPTQNLEMKPIPDLQAKEYHATWIKASQKD